MKKTIVILSISLIFSVLLSAVLAYLWIDRSISLSYMMHSYETEKNSMAILEKLISLEWKGLSKQQLQMKLESATKEMAYLDAVIKDDGSTIWVNQVAFILINDRVERVGDSKP